VKVAVSMIEDHRRLRHSAGAVLTDRDVLAVQGEDSESFLQGQLSQDVAALTLGESAWSLLLHPDGKLHSVLRVTRAANGFICDLDAGAGETALARLERFKLRVAVELEVRRERMLALRGPAVPPMPAVTGPAKVAGVQWGSVPGWDLVAAEVVSPPGVPVCEGEALEALRIEAGVPAAGCELTDGLIPAESGIVPEAVSFTKGCFVGQELVARIDSRGGNTPRRLRGLVLEDTAAPQPGAAVHDPDGAPVGRITSSAYSPELGAAVALGYVHRRVQPPAPARIEGAGGAVHCEIRNLPLVP
jgi:folate-binding protein YgfZ